MSQIRTSSAVENTGDVDAVVLGIVANPHPERTSAARDLRALRQLRHDSIGQVAIFAPSSKDGGLEHLGPDPAGELPHPQAAVDRAPILARQQLDHVGDRGRVVQKGFAVPFEIVNELRWYESAWRWLVPPAFVVGKLFVMNRSVDVEPKPDRAEFLC